MDILRNLRRLESRLAKKVNETAQKMAPSNSREPLEIVGAERRPLSDGAHHFEVSLNAVCVYEALHRARVVVEEWRESFECVACVLFGVCLLEAKQRGSESFVCLFR